ncbi:MAG: hypothetical protein DRG78_23620 [Epsilonproteobacteria bacterium]|nr:MAG: hypothetical protein DRG78_23620 [Campylobacterota bacterium]
MLKTIKLLLLSLLLAQTLYAIDNIDYTVEANLFYATYDDSYNNKRVDANKQTDKSSLFDKESSIGEFGLQLGVSADIAKWLDAGLILALTSPLGMQNFMVDGTFTGSTKTRAWVNEVWVGVKFKRTSLKIGRMQIDTPFLFSENWSVVPETFESAILHSNDIPDTTVYIATVGKYNGPSVLGGGYADYYFDNNNTLDVSDGKIFQDFHNHGAIAVGAINGSIENLSIQAWYYGVNTDPNEEDTKRLDGMKSYWLQADLEVGDKEENSYLAGIQYCSTDYNYDKSSKNDVLGLMIGYAHRDMFGVKLSYTHVGNDKINRVGAGKNLAGNQSQLYTEAWWAYGVITRNDTQAYNLSVQFKPRDYIIGAYYTQAKNKNGFAIDTPYESDADLVELTLELTKKITLKENYGELDIGLYYLYTEYANDNQPSETQKGKPYNSIHLDFTYNF